MRTNHLLGHLLCYFQMQKNPGTSDIHDRIALMGSDHQDTTADAALRDVGLSAGLLEGQRGSHFSRPSTAGQESQEDKQVRERLETEIAVQRKQKAVVKKAAKPFEFTVNKNVFSK